MLTEVRSAGWACTAALLFLHAASATSIPRLSFEELTDISDVIAAGSVARSWSAWDANHKHIWTHYEIAVEAAPKGATARMLEIAEPGGIVDGIGMSVAGSVSYSVGEKVMVFAQRMPNGYMRTTGWSQGKYSVDKQGIVHAGAALREAEIGDAEGAARTAGSSVRSLSGMTIEELTARVSSRLRPTQGLAPQIKAVQ